MTKEDNITLESLTGKPRSRVKKAGELKATTARARELFLFGNGDGKPVRSVEILAEKSGASPRTVENWLPVWKRESEALARGESAGKRGQVDKVTPEAVAWQADKVDRIKIEVERLKLVVAKLPAGSDMHRDTLKLLITALTKWEDASGFRDYVETGLAYQRELAKQAARLQGKESSAQPVRAVSGFAFNTAPTLSDSKPDAE